MTAKKIKVVGISEMKISKNPEDLLVTYSLGSCIGLTLYDPLNKIGAIIHCMLPVSKMNTTGTKKPCMYVDKGVVALLESVFCLGVRKKNLIAKVAGGASRFDDSMFKIGERNYAVLRKILWRNDILITSEDVGGNDSRTLSIDIGTGVTTVKYGSNGSTKEL